MEDRIVIVKVTKNHIQHGVKCHALNCPISQAFRDAGLNIVLGPYNLLFVGTDSYKYVDNIDCTPKMAKFIRDFDCGRPVEPFSIKVRIRKAA